MNINIKYLGFAALMTASLSMRPRHHAHHVARLRQRVQVDHLCRRRAPRHLAKCLGRRPHLCLLRTQLHLAARRLHGLRLREGQQLRLQGQLQRQRRLQPRTEHPSALEHSLRCHQQQQQHHCLYRQCRRNQQRTQPHQGTGLCHTRLHVHDAGLALLVCHRQRPERSVRAYLHRTCHTKHLPPAIRLRACRRCTHRR